MQELGSSASFLFLALLYIIAFCTAQQSNDPHELLNWCIDGVRHKERPSAEDELHGQCTPWKTRSCCTHNVSRQIHTTASYNFEWTHCGELSPKCKRHFNQDLCFYECEPNVGPWVVKVDNMKMRKERFFKVPLCASDCDAWYRDCQDDFTCVENWVTMFEWKNGKNKCPLTKACKPLLALYKDAKDFCETIWDGSWKYTPDNEPCMRLWFDGSRGNPNDRVAQLRVDELIAEWNGQQPLKSNFALYIFSVLLTSALVLNN